MALIECYDVSFTYAQAKQPALIDVSLSIEPGQFVVLCGPSGSGKSTLLRLLKRELSPGGVMNGSILLGGIPIEAWETRAAAALVGLVQQHPDNQLVVDTVEHELAFGMENFGLPYGEMRRRMAEMTGFFGLEPLLYRKTDELSGGQKQTVNLAAVLMLQPRILLLDEPLAQLDPLAARDLLGMLKRLNEDWGITVILSEHRIDDLLSQADRVIRLDRGRIEYDGPPHGFALEAQRRQSDSWLLALPSITRWALGHDPAQLPPLSVKEARSFVQAAERQHAVLNDGSMNEAANSAGIVNATGSAHVNSRSGGTVGPPGSTGITDTTGSIDSSGTTGIPPGSSTGAALLRAKGIFYGYDSRSPAVLRDLHWQVHPGEWIALFGGNGSGKSTLLQLLAGLRKPQRGEVKLEGTLVQRIPEHERYARIGYLAQNPLLHYIHETLAEDLLHAAARAGAADPHAAMLSWAQQLGIDHLLDRHPYDLSGGERQLGALAMTLFSQPRLLLLDEPTKGLDPMAKLRFARHLDMLRSSGTTLVVATHDVEFAAEYASRCALLFQGEIVADDQPEPFFHGNLFYTTALHRLYSPARPPAQHKENR